MRALFPIVSLLCVIALTGCSNGNSGGVVPAVNIVREYVVTFAKKTGEVITEKATSLSEAILSIWLRLFPEWEGNVRVDPTDPLKGNLKGEFRYKLVVKEPGGKETKLNFSFHDPLMRRSSRDAAWDLDPLNYQGVGASNGQ